ncbi:TetR family transcriptional regulator [Serratia fonticola]|jgi:TetR/AcrR family transcriptional repressor of nem operon|uniref:TetR family transcriptional regulator n=1 Tax=Serratia fonticola TaxID=47917 RepID=A0A559TBQ9_SERFO|nr:TetR/AcrR family transcriptional regulator [Serratia fonticola]TQI80426.1 TetR family transcriptional regulator [Serratia fonticola]TQI97548.1 TetR family transcriptional regulator [Serratia fonticola]TVZ72046.1 TetR family transcriptional regulator [Serratia fonticola]
MPPITDRKSGRPREFDITLALDNAIKYFRVHGYNGGSMADISLALNLSVGSIYKAFKSKHGLFYSALVRYQKLRSDALAAITEGAVNGRQKVRYMLEYYAEYSHATEGRDGCLMITGAVELANLDAAVAAKVSAGFVRNEERLAGYIREGQHDGSIPAGKDAEAIAKTLLTLLLGMRIMGKTGQERETMLAVVETAMRLLD